MWRMVEMYKQLVNGTQQVRNVSAREVPVIEILEWDLAGYGAQMGLCLKAMAVENSKALTGKTGYIIEFTLAQESKSFSLKKKKKDG